MGNCATSRMTKDQGSFMDLPTTTSRPEGKVLTVHSSKNSTLSAQNFKLFNSGKTSISTNFQSCTVLAEPQPNTLLLDKYKECVNYFQQHNIDSAYALAEELLTKKQLFEGSPDKAQMLQVLKEIQQQYLQVMSYSKELNKSSWVYKSTVDGVRISTCDDDGNVAVLIESELCVPIQIFIAVVTQVDLYSKFMPFMEYSRLEKINARNSRIGHSISDYPFISKRQAFFQGIGYDRLKHNRSLFLYTKSIHDKPEVCKKLNYTPSPRPDSVLLDYRYFVLEYTPLNQSKGDIRICINVDMQLSFVPKFILDYATRQFGLEFFQNIVKISKRYHESEWKTYVGRHPQLFDFFKNRIHQTLSQYPR